MKDTTKNENERVDTSYKKIKNNRQKDTKALKVSFSTLYFIKIRLNMFLIPQLSVKIEIRPSSKL